ncbi:DNA-binding domain of Mlu1-box binding protein MBP1 [Plenodomus tracheiphilus IPT5]|uniref:DNA-binding domain of Mlu1-box binding protein MBP1 n=1 Tax=Plenodomus tracheiphilus IPT5 TaxID=1408161 RepID=A0A6A7B654_9PLEO|nr:DNA-binding domain of Mlu1-box binding protein MBP1 [Plenodomus tracheiphilus IPT5]
MKISSLLNPFCSEKSARSSPESPTRSSSHALIAGMVRRQRVPKDAPIFTEGNRTVGHVNFPPHEAGYDQYLLDQHRRFQVFPAGEIAKKGIRHIPYNSDKKDFLEKTGREAFEMFQYTYKRPGDDKEYVVVWDYNVGLVRMTPFFKSCKYSKTIPAKALRENPGLKDISYSITGGALVCQGYWFPYEAAKAVAATFCYDIRWALTPVFGDDFPGLCLRPKDPRYAKFLIEPAIVQHCTRETDRFREEGPSYLVMRTTSTPVEAPSTSARVQVERRTRPADIESGYGTDTDRSDKYFCSPQVSPRSQFTPINRTLSPRSPFLADSFSGASPVNTHYHQALLAVTSAPAEYDEVPFRTKRTLSKVAFSDNCDEDQPTRPPTAATVDSCYSGRTSGGFSSDNSHTHVEIDAAEMLLSLRTDGDTQPPTKRTRRGSQY